LDTNQIKYIFNVMDNLQSSDVLNKKKNWNGFNKFILFHNGDEKFEEVNIKQLNENMFRIKMNINVKETESTPPKNIKNIVEKFKKDLEKYGDSLFPTYTG